jgi:hypothetical protein
MTRVFEIVGRPKRDPALVGPAVRDGVPKPEIASVGLETFGRRECDQVSRTTKVVEQTPVTFVRCQPGRLVYLLIRVWLW